MRALAQKPNPNQQTTAAKGTTPGLAQFGSGMTALASPGAGHDFSHVPSRGSIARATPEWAGSDEAGARRMAGQALSMQDSASPASGEAGSAPPSGSGMLAPGTRAMMESGFGHNFADVRVFTGHEPGESALGLGAEAYAYGSAIVFAPGHYAPHSDAGRSLIAHELAHVVQQRGQQPRIQCQQASQAQAFDRGYQLYFYPAGTRYSRSTGRYELSNWDLGHLVRRGGFYFLVTERISLITPPEVRRAAPAGAPGSGVLLPITPADYTAMAGSADATVARIVRDQLGITVPRMTHATGQERDFSQPDLPGPMARALEVPGSGEAAQTRQRAAGIAQAPTLELAAQRGGELPIHEIGMSDLMSQNTILREMSSGARAEWYVQKLGPYQAQLYASAQRHHIPTQLLAVVILNELSDINFIDVAQSGDRADWGSLGIAQIQVTTAMAENLVDVTAAEADAAYRQHVARTRRLPDVNRLLNRNSRSPDATRPLNEYERRVGRRLSIGRQLQVPQVGIEAAAREIEILINRMSNNIGSPWQRRFNFRAHGAAGDAIYNAVGPPNASQAACEGMLAMLVSGAYNSPHVIETGDPDGFTNALIHGRNAQSHAIRLHQLGIFRAVGAPSSWTSPPARVAPTGATPALTAPVTGMHFDGSRLSLFGGPAVSIFNAVSGLRPNNSHNRDHLDHTGRSSQAMPNIGPIPEGSYYVKPGELRRTGFNTSIWGPVLVPIHEELVTEITRRWNTSRTGGFCIHEDVSHDGTAGCIGLQRRPDTIAVFARIGATTEQIPLEVRYPRRRA